MDSPQEYKVLECLPTYGPMYVSIGNRFFEYTEGFVVQFRQQDGNEWVANFAKGRSKLNGVFDLQDAKYLVVAGGSCYVMRADGRRPIDEFGGEYEFAFTRDNGQIILVSWIDITVVEPTGMNWDSPRISWDGIKDVSLEGSRVSGQAWAPETGEGVWRPFSYDIDSKVLDGGSWNGL